MRDLDQWMTEGRSAVNVSKSNAVLFAEAAWRVPRLRPVNFLGDPIEWVDTARYLGVTLSIHV
jgi:hypothetical protein